MDFSSSQPFFSSSFVHIMSIRPRVEVEVDCGKPSLLLNQQSNPQHHSSVTELLSAHSRSCCSASCPSSLHRRRSLPLLMIINKTARSRPHQAMPQASCLISTVFEITCGMFSRSAVRAPVGCECRAAHVSASPNPPLECAEMVMCVLGPCLIVAYRLVRWASKWHAGCDVNVFRIFVYAEKEA